MSAVSGKPRERKAASDRRRSRSGEAPHGAPIPPINGFFGNRPVFQALQTTILPRLMKIKAPGNPIRVWVPGISTGAEAYSIAICLLEASPGRPATAPIQIFGTDIEDQTIRKARAGIYPESALLEVSPDRLGRFFVKDKGDYRVTSIVREMCLFARQDVTKDPPFSKLDLISGSVALASLEPAVQKKVLAIFHYALRDTGFLLLGELEAPRAYRGLFTIVDQKKGIFVKRPARAEASHERMPAPCEPPWHAANQAEKGPSAGPPGEDSKEAEILRLKDELARALAKLQSTIHQNETTSAELRTTNEEFSSLVEELRCTNEELETAKEELQSSNEELTVLHDLAINRNLELAKVSDDLTNVLGGVNIPIVMLGLDRKIRMVTPAAGNLLHVLPRDVGRPIGDIRMGVTISDLEALVAAVLVERRELEREVRGEDGRWYSIHVRPYWMGTGKIDGVLLALLDIHALKENQEAARREERFVSAILDAAGRAALVVVLDAEGRITHFNRACQELSGYSLEEVRGRRPWDFLIVPEEVAGVEGVFRELIGGTMNVHENYWVTKDGRQRLITWWNNIIAGEDGRMQYAIGSGIDVTERQQAREQARQSEATVRALLETAAQAIIGINSAGLMVLANAAAEAIFGYMREEMLDQPLERLIPPRLLQQHLHGRLAFFEGPQNWRIGGRLDVAGLRKDGTEFPAEISLSHVATGEGSLAVAFITDITERKRNEAVLRRSEAEARATQQRLRELTAGLLEAQEEERRRVSRELHDDLNQRLAMLAVEIGSIEAKIPESEHVTRRQLLAMETRLKGLSNDVRRTAYQLHPSVLEHLGLVDALETYCSEFSGQGAIHVDFRVRKVPGSIPKGVALCLYRVAQEALRNAASHSGAARVTVTLAGMGGEIMLSIEDQGRGFDLSVVEGKRGLGLISMKERVTTAGGCLTIDARPGAGTLIQIRIPLAGKSENE